jgi:alginate O-acetyltransferase complex protein AlgI
MTPEALFLVLASVVLVPLSRLVPSARLADTVAVITACSIFALSPLSAIWLAGTAGLTGLVMAVGDRSGMRDLLTAVWAGILIAALLLLREIPAVFWVGGAYFTLRNLHLLFDWWMAKLERPSVARILRYQLFLPVIMAGPIHRFQTFERQWARRRNDVSDVAAGAERVLLGLAQALLLGNWLVKYAEFFIQSLDVQIYPFLVDWAASALDWIALYFIFAGFSSVALGLSLMLGLRLEENFNRPYLARNLIDFWSRWHITLSQWCRDYVFHPVTAVTRSPVLGVLAAMGVIGLWHEASTYYLLWSAWQALGLILTRLVQKLLARPGMPNLPDMLLRVTGPVAVLGWLSLARPVITHLFLGNIG